MDRFAKLLQELAAEHERLRRECDGFRTQSEAWAAVHRGCCCHKVGKLPAPDHAVHADGIAEGENSREKVAQMSSLPSYKFVASLTPCIADDRADSPMNGFFPPPVAGGARRPSSPREEVCSNEVDAMVLLCDVSKAPPIASIDPEASMMLCDSSKEQEAPESEADESMASFKDSMNSDSVSTPNVPGSGANTRPKRDSSSSKYIRPLRTASCRSADAGEERAGSSRWRRQKISKRCSSKASLEGGLPDCKLWPQWTSKAGVQRGHDATRILATKTSGALLNANLSNPQFPVQEWDCCLQSLVMMPGCRRRIIWDILSSAVLAYDILMVPMVAFVLDDDDLPEGEILDLVTTCFWTFDILCSFFTGFHTEGLLEMRPNRIASRYLRGWFWLDFPVIVLDWCASLLLSGQLGEVVGILRINKVVRVVRVLRVFRLLRMAKMPGWADNLFDNMRSDTLITAMGIFRSLLIILVSSHYIACLWYSIGLLESEPYTWLMVLDGEGRELPYRYITALHWSVTQFTPASMEVTPRNTPERGFAIVVILSAMVAFSCFVSSITQAMARLQRLHAERDRQRSFMRRFLTENHISLELGSQISKFARTQNIMARRRVKEKDVTIFQLLPESLRQELHFEVYAPLLSLHPLFEATLDLDDGFVQEISHTAMSEVSHARYEELFHPGQEASKVYFTRSGLWEYRRHWDDPHSVTVSGESVVCEVALWLQWELQGVLVASTSCEVACLGACKFHDSVASRPALLSALCEYASEYRSKLKQAGGAMVAEIELLPDVLPDGDLDTIGASMAVGRVMSRIASTGASTSSPSGRRRKRRFTPTRL